MFPTCVIFMREVASLSVMFHTDGDGALMVHFSFNWIVQFRLMVIFHLIFMYIGDIDAQTVFKIAVFF